MNIKMGHCLTPWTFGEPALRRLISYHPTFTSRILLNGSGDFTGPAIRCSFRKICLAHSTQSMRYYRRYLLKNSRVRAHASLAAVSS